MVVLPNLLIHRAKQMTRQSSLVPKWMGKEIEVGKDYEVCNLFSRQKENAFL